ncbi:MAG TPA: transcriptional repressor [Candidatus Omnitrophica bacterium]|nr:transcriptional repressor [Candidatus Omnitrophota bacterium]
MITITIINKMKDRMIRRNTKQRQIILDELGKVKTHPSADTLFKMVRKRIPDISYGTIYRNLNLLKDENRVLELSFGKHSCRYDGTVKEHFHLFCLKCENVFDVEEAGLGRLDKKIADKMNFRVEYHRLEFFGYCDSCKTKAVA